MQYIQEITLDLYQPNYVYVYAKQGDADARFLRIHLTANGVEFKPDTGVSAAFRALKRDGKSIDNPAVIDADGTILACLTDQTLAVAGEVTADIVLKKGTEVISTLNFVIVVQPAPQGADLPSTNELGEMNQATADAVAAAKSANTAAGKANTAAQGANTATEAANEAAALLDGLTVTASKVAAGGKPTAKLTKVDDHYNLALGLVTGDTGPVAGVKGHAESAYRTGNVDITPADVGAAPAIKRFTVKLPAASWSNMAQTVSNANILLGDQYEYAWCDVFVDWCFFKAFGKTEGQMLECQTGTLGAACPYSASYYKAQGRYDTTPRVGDQVFFQKSGELVHTGIVAEVTAGQIVTVEGNSSNMVAKRTYSRTDSYIAGYGHPKYTEADAAVPAPAPEPETAAGVTATLPVLRRGVTGSAAVKTVQRILYARNIRDDAGKQIAVDGSFGTKTGQAVVKLQKSLFPGEPSQWDGVVGEKTWQKMLTQLW